MKRNTIRSFVTVTLLAAALITAFSQSLMGLAVPKASQMTDVVSFPLPSLPEPLLLGGDLRVEVKAGSGTSGWEASISSRFGSASLDYLNSSYVKDRWILYFGIPSDLTPELYDLTVSYQEGGEDVEYTHPKCVWLLEAWPEELTISHISDLHQQHGRDSIAQYIHEVNMFDPDLIIATGDIVQTETVAAGWDYLRHEMDWIEAPFYMLPGNHDHAGGGSLIYQRYGGPLNYSVVIGDFLFIALDSHLEGQEWMNQFQWVESVLQRNPGKVKVMAWHHPLLSSEYEEDEGLVKGGYLNGSWEAIEAFSNTLYPSWVIEGEPSNAAVEMLRVIQQYDISLILTGHVHRDMIYILNDRHYFVTSGPVGGGLTPGQYHPSRLITLDSEGNVELDAYAQARLFDPPNSIPVDGLNYWHSSANDWSESAVTATIENELEMDLPRARLEFRVSSEYSVDDYQFSTEPVEYETYTTDDGHIFVAYFDVPTGTHMDVTLYVEGDALPPEILVQAADYVAGQPVKGTVTVSDTGWGVDTYSVSYVNDGMATWEAYDFSFSPTINGDVYDITWPEFSYSFTVPVEQALPGLKVKVEAADHAGNTVTYTTEDLTALPTHIMSIDTDPSGIEVTVDGDVKATPHSEELEEGSYTVSVPEDASLSGKDYTFAGWEDGVSGDTRTVSLEGDTSLTAIYEEAQVEEPVEEPTEEEPEEPEEPSGPAWIPLPMSYVVLGLILGICVIYLLNKR